MPVKIRKATEGEKKNYAATNPVHPLFGYIRCYGVLNKVRTSWECPVEGLFEGRGEPNYEVLAPPGMQFVPDYVTSLLGFTQKDLIERVCSNDLEVRTEE